ncbi:hypothetical protein IL306_013608 [Fusarium sp. DS 682]|nr:hypothetical protein IL306_013608 [Fusarium sp. DS 682]
MPTPSSALEQMPTELLCMIGSHLRNGGFKVATLLSKHLRSIFLPQLFKKVTFSGTLRKLAAEMKSLLDGDFKDSLPLILSFAKTVTICFERSTMAESTDLQLSATRTAVINEFVYKISSVSVIAFDYPVDDPKLNCHLEAAMVMLLCFGPAKAKWNGPKTVVFPGPRNLPMFNSILRQFAPGTVEAVHLSRACAWCHRYVLQLKCPLLKGLKVEVSATDSESRTLACIDHKLLGEIAGAFPHLESLVLDQLDCWEFEKALHPIDKKPNLPVLNTWVNKLILQLESIPRLRCFAFTLQREWMDREYNWELPDEREERLKRADPPAAASEQDEWPYYLSTVEEVDGWHARLIARILNAVPQLEELCVKTSAVVLHRGTKTEGVVTVRRVDTEDPREEPRFPSALLK